MTTESERPRKTHDLSKEREAEIRTACGIWERTSPVTQRAYPSERAAIELLAALDAERKRVKALEERVERLRAGLKLYLCGKDHRQGGWCAGARAKNALEADARAAKENA